MISIAIVSLPPFDGFAIEWLIPPTGLVLALGKWRASNSMEFTDHFL